MHQRRLPVPPHPARGQGQPPPTRIPHPSLAPHSHASLIPRPHGTPTRGPKERTNLSVSHSGPSPTSSSLPPSPSPATCSLPRHPCRMDHRVGVPGTAWLAPCARPDRLVVPLCAFGPPSWSPCRRDRLVGPMCASHGLPSTQLGSPPPTPCFPVSFPYLVPRQLPSWSLLVPCATCLFPHPHLSSWDWVCPRPCLTSHPFGLATYLILPNSTLGLTT